MMQAYFNLLMKATEKSAITTIRIKKKKKKKEKKKKKSQVSYSEPFCHLLSIVHTDKAPEYHRLS